MLRPRSLRCFALEILTLLQLEKKWF
jgi:hypothetical protein